MNKDKKTFTPREAAKYLCSTYSGFQNWCRPDHKIKHGYYLVPRAKNGFKYFTREDLDSFLKIRLDNFKMPGRRANYIAKLRAQGTIE